ncbi:MAG: hypothetical protein WGN25_06790 [Candidatus Electrothrix sp. GW3-4]|uniref:hypothetical protein n=1 Tax=Candidatus Electrothrix sp. GW3-4 TaxID=3126740 RepID=UPI0030CCCBE6
MDIITAAIAGALANLGAAAVQKGYGKLKAVMQRKFGADSDVVQATEKLEQKPEAQGRKLMLQEELVAAAADKDAELIKAAEELLAEVKKQPGGEAFVQQVVNQQITGDGNIFSGTGNVTVTK